MIAQDQQGSDKLAQGNRRVALACVLFFLSMFGLAFAAVPLYSWFCRVTGFAGTPQIANVAPGAGSGERLITVRFDANIGAGLPWRFEAISPPVTFRLGEPFLATYRATNLSDRETTGTAAFNVTPQQSGGYFAKVECFCFTEQHLKAGESQDLTVSFFVDPELAADANLGHLDTITLSYTFFPVRQPARTSAFQPVEQNVTR